MNRRQMIRSAVGGTVGMGILGAAPALAAGNDGRAPLKGNIRHSVCRWVCGYMPIDVLCATVKEIGFSAVDLVGPKDWAVLKAHGVDSSMCNGAEIGLTQGWNHPEFHETLVQRYTDHIGLVADAGYTNLICFSGNRNGMDDETGMQHCVTGLKRILGHAERRGVVLQMELFNSKVDHPDYMCDSSAWGIELCKRLDSPNFKLLYDIYHMQVNEGDIIRTIRDHHAYFGHYHTAGVPGRHEIDDSQELYYPAIMKAVAATGFKGYVAQEFIFTKDTDAEKVAALSQAIRICDV